MPKIKVTLDPGHIKDYNRGAVSPYCEGNAMFDLALYLKDELERKGIFQVYLTKTKVTECPSLTARGQAAIKNGSRLFLSLHSNGANGKAYGVSEFVSLYRSSQTFAKGLGDEVVKLFKEFGSSKTYNRGPSTRKGNNGDYYGVIRSAVKSEGIQHVVLVEHGFHDNKEECAVLNQTKFLEKLAVVEAQYIYNQMKQYYLDDSVKTYDVKVTSKLNIRSGPTTNDTIVGYFAKGSLAKVISVDNGWARVLHNGCIAFASTLYLSLPKSGIPSYNNVKNPLPGVETTPKPAEPDSLMTEEAIWKFLMTEFNNEYGVAGLMGNLQAESGLQPKNLQNSFEKKLGYTDATYTAAVDKGIYTKFATDGAGYGLAQWTYHTRKQGLLDLAKKQGVSIGDANMQLSYLIQELKTSYKKVYEGLKTATDIREASNLVLLNFEKPASMNSTTTQNTRAEYSKQIWQKYSTKSDTNIGAISTEVCLGVGKTTAVLNVRTGPGTKFTSVGQFAKDAEITVYTDALTKDTGWYRVRGVAKDNATSLDGYACGDYIIVPGFSNAKLATTTTAVNVRTGPSTDYKVVCTLPINTSVYVLEAVDTSASASSEWVRVILKDEYESIQNGLNKYPDSKYMCKKYLLISSNTTTSGNDTAAKETHKMPYGVAVITTETPVLAGADKTYDQVGVVDPGTSVVLTGHMANGYDQILFGSNIAYVAASALEVKMDIGTKFESFVTTNLPKIDDSMKSMIAGLPEITAVDWFTTTLKGTFTEAGDENHSGIGATNVYVNHGINVHAAGGTPIYAIVDGLCIDNSHDCDGYGNYLMVLSIDGKIHVYANMKSAGIPKVGDLVVAGQKIGYVGATGYTNQNQLHYEILDQDMQYIWPDDYQYPEAMCWETITA